MGVRPPVRQHSSPDAVRIRLLMKRHKEPAPATPSTPAPQTRAPGLARPRGLCARSPMLPASRRAPGPQSPRPSGVPRAPRFRTGAVRALRPTRAHAPLSGSAPGTRPPHSRTPLTSCACQRPLLLGARPAPHAPALSARRRPGSAPRPARPERRSQPPAPRHLGSL